MTNETIRKFQKQVPFQAFDIHLADGRVVHVPHPDFVYVPPINERTVVATDSKGIPEHINMLVVISVKESPESGKKRRKAG